MNIHIGKEPYIHNYLLHGFDRTTKTMFFGGVHGSIREKPESIRYHSFKTKDSGIIEMSTSNSGFLSFSLDYDAFTYLVFESKIIYINKATKEAKTVDFSAAFGYLSVKSITYIGPGFRGPCFGFTFATGTSYGEYDPILEKIDSLGLVGSIAYVDRKNDISVSTHFNVEDDGSYISFSKNPIVGCAHVVNKSGKEYCYYTKIIAVNPDGRRLYFSDEDCILEVDLNSSSIVQRYRLDSPFGYFNIPFGSFTWINEDVAFIRMGYRGMFLDTKKPSVFTLNCGVHSHLLVPNNGVFVFKNVSRNDCVWSFYDHEYKARNKYTKGIKWLTGADEMIDRIHL